jgi:hypothetical protein
MNSSNTEQLVDRVFVVCNISMLLWGFDGSVTARDAVPTELLGARTLKQTQNYFLSYQPQLLSCFNLIVPTYCTVLILVMQFSAYCIHGARVLSTPSLQCSVELGVPRNPR